jgi:hypothetical protein
MDIQARHHVDEGERDADGYCDHRYAYTEFVIRLDNMKAGFRLYDNESVVYVEIDVPAQAEIREQQRVMKGVNDSVEVIVRRVGSTEHAAGCGITGDHVINKPLHATYERTRVKAGVST